MKGFIEVTQRGENGRKTLIQAKEIKAVEEFEDCTVIVFAPFSLKKSDFYSYITVTETYSEVVDKIAQALA